MARVSSSCNETGDVNAVFIRKPVRDAHLPGSFNGELKQVPHGDHEAKLTGQQDISRSGDYGMIIGGENNNCLQSHGQKITKLFKSK